MSIARLVRHFEGLGQAPIPISDVVAEFRRIMPNDGLRVTGVDLPSDVLRGAHYSYIHQPSPGSALLPAPVTQVIYSINQPVDWQRLVICKELIHVFDRTGVKTDMAQEVIDLVKNLSGESNPIIKTGNIQWFFDELAQYQAVAILFPFSLRESLNGRAIDEHLIQRLCEELMLPEKAINFVLMDAWKDLRESMLLQG